MDFKNFGFKESNFKNLNNKENIYYVFSGKDKNGNIIYFYYDKKEKLRYTNNFNKAYRFKNIKLLNFICNQKDFQEYKKTVSSKNISLLKILDDFLIEKIITIKNN